MLFKMAWRALLFFIVPVALGAYVPGTPGAPWTEEQAVIIRLVELLLKTTLRQKMTFLDFLGLSFTCLVKRQVNSRKM